MRPRPLVTASTTLLAIVAILAGGVSVQTAEAHHRDAHHHGPPECVEGYRDYPGTGRACRNERGNYNVELENGQILETHGPDESDPSVGPVAAPGGNGNGKGGKPTSGGGGDTSPPATYFGGVCTSSGERTELIYAVAHDDVDNYGTAAPEMRRFFVNIDTYLNEESNQFGTQMHYNVLCDPDGQPTVRHAVLPTTSRYAFSFHSIVNDLSRLGYRDRDVNYWVFFDEPGAFGGQANSCAVFDPYDELNNQCVNRWSAYYGITYGYWSSRIFMHENGHNMGAVQDSAPHSSGRGHCNDGMDIMCYADGGPTSRYSTVCNDRQHFDCNHDDYFHPQPPADSYLANEWNLASCLNRFLVSSRCDNAPEATAGTDRTCTVLLDCSTGGGTAWDPDYDLASWQWSFLNCPAGGCPTLNGASGTFSPTLKSSLSVPAASFRASASGTYTLQLSITDRRGNGGIDELVITVP